MTDTDNGAQRNLAAMRLPELRKIASDMGLKGTSALRKGDLIAAISGAQGAGQAEKPAKKVAAPAEPAQTADAQEATEAPVATEAAPKRRRATKQASAPKQVEQEEKAEKADKTEAPAPELAPAEDKQQEEKPRRRRAVRHESAELATATHEETVEAAQAPAEPTSQEEPAKEEPKQAESGDEETRYESRSAARRARRNRARREQREGRDGRDNRENRDNRRERTNEAPAEQAQDSASQPAENVEKREGGEREERNNNNNREERGGRRNRRNRRGRDRDRDNNNNEGGNEQREDEALQDIAGILDVVDNNVAFVRTSGYHAGPADVYVNTQMLRRFGLRAGDAITGQVRTHGEAHHSGRGRNRQKYNPLVRVDSVNGMTVEEAKARPEFAKLTPLYPNQRLRLETDPKILTTRVIDLIMPIGKGQRALIVSPPKAGKTTILQNIANAISTNNPECYLMVVLVDERPEEVTDMQRSVKGEVIASTFDRPPAEHTAVAELAIERAKRLVEQGQDVVILLDSITRLGRAYNNSSPASGRILSGGVDSNALYPPKRFLGAARNIENGGSLTIIATAMVETGSAGDTVIFEEFKGTGNAELKLDRKISERRVFPAVDVNPSGTRKDELLLAPEEAKIMHKLRRILSALDPQQAIDLLIKQLKKTKSNGEFLMQIASSQTMAAVSEED